PAPPINAARGSPAGDSTLIVASRGAPKLFGRGGRGEDGDGAIMAYRRPNATRYAGCSELSGYDPLLIELLKTLPRHAREYNPERRTWTIRAPYDDRAIGWFRERFPGAPVFDRPSRAGYQAPPPPRRPLAE